LLYGSDFGQLQNIPHITANRWMIKLLLAYGCTKEEIRTVFQVTGAKLLGLEPPAPLGTQVHPGGVPLEQRRYLGHPQADPHARRLAHGIYPIAPTPDSTPDRNAACLC
jgi:hypothetical protein